MGNWYFVVGLMAGGASAYIFSKTAKSFAPSMPQGDIDGLTVMLGIAMILVWGVVLLFAIMTVPVLFGIFAGKIVLRGSEGIYPKLVAIWKAFD